LSRSQRSSFRVAVCGSNPFLVCCRSSSRDRSRSSTRRAGICVVFFHASAPSSSCSISSWPLFQLGNPFADPCGRRLGLVGFLSNSFYPLEFDLCDRPLALPQPSRCARVYSLSPWNPRLWDPYVLSFFWSTLRRKLAVRRSGRVCAHGPFTGDRPVSRGSVYFKGGGSFFRAFFSSVAILFSAIAFVFHYDPPLSLAFPSRVPWAAFSVKQLMPSNRPLPPFPRNLSVFFIFFFFSSTGTLRGLSFCATFPRRSLIPSS